MVEADNAWLKRSESHHRAIKMSLVQQHCPQLIPQFEQQQKDKADKKNGVSKKTAISKVSTPSVRGTGCFPASMHAHKPETPILLGLYLGSWLTGGTRAFTYVRRFSVFVDEPFWPMWMILFHLLLCSTLQMWFSASCLTHTLSGRSVQEVAFIVHGMGGSGIAIV